jgi:hypothetical protein
MMKRIRSVRLWVALVVAGGLVLSVAAFARNGAPSVPLPGVAPSNAPIQQKMGAPGAIPAASPAAAMAPAVAGNAFATDAAQQRGAAIAPGAAASTTAMEQAAAQPFDRMVIRSAQLGVEVANIEQALAQARSVATRSGGFVSASNTRVEKVNDQDRMVADLTLQVRSDSADSALSELRALGKVTTETSGSQDVTEEFTDLESNLRNLQASESAILRLMDKASRIEDVITLQRELTNIRGQIERIQGRKNYLQRRSDMATITLALRLPPVEGARIGTGGWDPFAVAQRGWQASLALLRGVAEAVIVVVAFSWWLVPFVALGVYLWLQRRRPAAQAQPPASTPATP